MTDGPDLADVAQLSYEQARDELVDVVARLESGSASLEDSLALWERGEALADRCQSVIDDARARLTAAREGARDGDARSEEPADDADGVDDQEESP